MKFLSLRHDLKNMQGFRIVLTYQCNYRCKFCYQKTKKGQIIPLDEFENQILMIPREYTPTYITLMGGEIFTIPNFAEYIKVLRKRWPVVSISITSNGSGAVEFYKNLFEIGVNNITFSLSTLDEEEYKNIVNVPVSCKKYQDKIIEIAKFGQVRINSYIYPKNVESIYKFCKRNNLKLTFCEELREENQCVFAELKKTYQFQVKQKSKFEIVYKDKDGFEFWNYIHQDHYDYNNLIMLPDGTFTDDFGDVVQQKGDRAEKTLTSANVYYSNNKFVAERRAI